MSLHDHQLIITVNRRLARFLARQFAAHQVAAGREVWETPEILPWSSWMTCLWKQSLARSAVLLSDSQSRVLWERIIRHSKEGEGLLQIGETTRMAMEAWQLLHDYELDFDQTRNDPAVGGLDTRAFFTWADQYRQQLQDQNWLDQAMLPARLVESFEQGSIVIPPRLMLAGFGPESQTPAQHQLLACLRTRGCQIERWQPQGRDPVVQRISCRDSQAELRMAALCIRQRLEQNPAQRIGVVVADLHNRKATIRSIFEDVLSPGAVMKGPGATPPFNISLGEPLYAYPVIKTAFLILSLAVEKLPLEALSRLIRSPFIAGSETEITQRSLLDAQLRESGEEYPDLRYLIRQAGKTGTPKLVEILEQSQTLIDEWDVRKKRSLTESIPWVDELLRSMGWPGERVLDSTEKQAVEAWQGACEQCLSLDLVTGKMDFRSVLHHLQKLARERIFQPETGQEVPVEIMGMLEAAGQQFDFLMVMGMTDDQWPAKPTPNPFIPFSIQRQARMLHAHMEAGLAFARSLIQQLKQSADEVVFSYPQHEGDRVLRFSPLIRDLHAMEMDDAGYPDPYRWIQTGASLERVEDNQAPPLPANASQQGGVGIFKDQAACPFRAFVAHRLKARPLGVAEPGLNPAERGSLIHDALEILWGRLGSQEKLMALSHEQVRREIKNAVASALDRFRCGKSVFHMAGFQDLERARLETLLMDWLEKEKEREPFTVLAREQAMEAAVGGIRFQTRIDRIDRVEGGEQVLIDYKTGAVSTKSWEGDRPDEPQLPLYAISMETPPAAVVFAQLKKGNLKYDGHSSVPGIVKRLHENWDQQISEWRTTMERLATDFIQGKAVVDPKEAKTCQYCSFTSLCRIQELIAFQEENPVSEDD